MEHAVEPHRLARLDPEGHDVLNLEVDRVSNADAVPQAVVAYIDRRTLDAQHLSHQRSERCHRPAELSTEHLSKLLSLLIRRAIVDEHAETPVPLRHDLRRVGDQRHGPFPDVRPIDLTLADVEHERHATEVIGGAMVQGQVARTHQLAGTRLDVAALEVPRHRDPLL